jgi:hypothetical protein
MEARVLERYLGVARIMTCGAETRASPEVGERDRTRSEIFAQRFERILVFDSD